MIAARLVPVADLDRFCIETRDALAAALNLTTSEIDFNLDVVPNEAGALDCVIWHEIRGDLSPCAVSAFRWSPAAGWEYTTGPFDFMDLGLNRWRPLDVRPDCNAELFGAAAAAVCGRAFRCAHCESRLQLFGGIWFQVGAGATCHRAPDLQHNPLPMPEATCSLPA